MSALEQVDGLFIGGRSRPSADGEWHELLEPATGHPLTSVTLADREDIDEAVAAARTALDGKWGRTSPSERSRLLHELAGAIEAHADELIRLEARNVGKAISSVRAEVGGAVGTLRYFAGAVSAIEGRAGAIGGSLLSYTLKEPVGVCAQIVPWNYPLTMAVSKIAPALAAGCALVLKPDPLTPLSALRVAELAAEVGLPDGALNVVPAVGPTTGAYLVGHQGVDKVSFTGSTASGANIMRTASDSIKRVTLELGGKSPNLIFADANLDDAVPSAVWSVYSAAGQSCEARSRLLVDQAIFDDVVERFVDRATRLRVGDPLDPETEIGSLISTGHRSRVHGRVEAAVAAGAEVLLGGQIPEGPGAFYPPTLLVGVDADAAIQQEEVFGPVVTIVPFVDEREAIELANDSRYGLMASVWTSDATRGPRIASRLHAGTVGVNMPYTTFPGVPFGGYKQSGFGREFALETLDDYLETKSVIVWTSSRQSSPWPA